MDTKFKKGHEKKGGRQKGVKDKKTTQWEALGKYIEEELAEDIMTTLQTLMRSPDTKNKVLGVELACKVLNYFKPKFQNTTSDIQVTGDPIYIIEAKDYEEGNLN